MIIVSITGPDMRSALRQVSVSSRFADAFEFRLDLINSPDIDALLRSTSKPTVATCRPTWEGGGFTGPEMDRVAILERASASGASYIDLELDMSPLLRSRFVGSGRRSKVIVSHHVLTPPSDVDVVYRRLCAAGGDVVKYAVAAADSYEARPAIDFLLRAAADGRKAIAIAMGDAGAPTRILYKKYGGWATYAAAETGAGAAPGQIPASELKKVYRTEKCSGTTRVFGVVGFPVSQSKGVFVHNEVFRLTGTDAVYCRFPVRDLEAFMRLIAPEMSGFSVTLPHKLEIMKYLDGVDRESATIGAVNTVIRRGQRWYGSNADAAGALDAIERVRRVKGKTVLVVGAGGAARAIAYAARRRGATVLLTNRTEEKAAALARALGVDCLPAGQEGSRAVDILVNATSVGMVPDTEGMPVPRALLNRRMVVFDAVYNPPLTRLLAEAKRAGARTVPGTEMYLNQAALQSRLFTGKRPPYGVMRRILNRQLHRSSLN